MNLVLKFQFFYDSQVGNFAISSTRNISAKTSSLDFILGEITEAFGFVHTNIIIIMKSR